MDGVLYSKVHEELRKSVRAFVEQHVAPAAREHDLSGEPPLAVYQAFFESGLLHGHIPEQFGGLGHDTVASAIVAEELAFGCAAVASALMVPVLPISMVLSAGTEAQKREFVLPLKERFALPALACTEIEAGSDLRAISTLAVREGDGYIISGEKAYITNLPFADWLVVVAATETVGAPGRGLTCFLVRRDTPGVKVGPRRPTLGLSSLAVCSCTFDRVFVPDSNRLGAEGEGLSLLNAGLDVSRIMMASFGVGGSRRVLAELMAYARGRRLFGEKLLRQQDYRFKLVEMEEAVASARLMVWLAAMRRDAGKRFTKEASLAKLHSGRVSQEVAARGCVMLGGAGYLRGNPVEKFYREAPAIALIEGPQPIQSEIVFSEMIRRGLY